MFEERLREVAPSTTGYRDLQSMETIASLSAVRQMVAALFCMTEAQIGNTGRRDTQTQRAAGGKDVWLGMHRVDILP
jgi:hypothetical protein